MNECTISGTISHVIYQNEENGYTVLRLVTSDGEAVTAVGSIPFAAPGEDLVVTGRWVSHPVHGDQVEVHQVERYMPTEENEILSYLSSGVVKGVGPATQRHRPALRGQQPDGAGGGSGRASAIKPGCGG